MPNSNKQYLTEDKELKLNSLKLEGIIYNLDKEQAEEQTVVEVGTDVEKVKVEKDDKQSFDDFKEMYKGVIDMKCQQDFGSADDKSLWEDTAKEMFLKAKHYIPETDVKPAGELTKKTESEDLTIEDNRGLSSNR